MTDDARPDPDRPLTLGDTPASPSSPDTPRPESTAPRPRDHRLPLIIGGLGVAAVLGLVVAITRPAPPERAEADVAGMSLEMVEPPPAPMPQAGAPLEVLAPDMADAANRSAELAREMAQQAPMVEPAPEFEMAEAADSPRSSQASFDCGDAASPAEEMVCSDSGLAAADRELARTYRRALDAGASSRELRASQQDWFDVREAAARRGPSAVSQAYNQRIEELDRIADELRR